MSLTSASCKSSLYSWSFAGFIEIVVDRRPQGLCEGTKKYERKGIDGFSVAAPGIIGIVLVWDDLTVARRLRGDSPFSASLLSIFAYKIVVPSISQLVPSISSVLQHLPSSEISSFTSKSKRLPGKPLSKQKRQSLFFKFRKEISTVRGHIPVSAYHFPSQVYNILLPAVVAIDRVKFLFPLNHTFEVRVAVTFRGHLKMILSSKWT